MKAFVSLFVRNDASPSAPPAVKTNQLSTLTCNLLPKLVRHDTMEGKEYIVVPMVILTEGVHKGSEGPLYYPPDELGKTPVVWNHKPVVVYHPEINGQGVSACDPSILTNRKVGLMMNTQWDKKNGRLKAEAWLEKDRADAVDPRIMEAIESNTMMELSTGVFVDSEANPGKWKTEDYVGVARNYRPDHLAILPDKIGACSVADGAGFLRNQEYKEVTLLEGEEPIDNGGPGSGPHAGGDHKEASAHADAMSKTAYKSGKKADHLAAAVAHHKAAAIYSGAGNGLQASVHTGRAASHEGRANLAMNTSAKDSNGMLKLLSKIAKKVGLATNDIPFDSIRSALQDAIDDDCGCNEDYYQGPHPWIMDVYTNFFVYSYEGELWQRGYTISDSDGVTLDEGDPVEVERVPPQYRPVAEDESPVNSQRKENKSTMNKEQIVNQLIANSSGHLTEADRPRLLAFSEDQLKRIGIVHSPGPVANKKAEDDTHPMAGVTSTFAGTMVHHSPVQGPGSNPTKNEKTEPTKVVTVNEYVAAAPKEVQEILNNGLASYNEEKSIIVKNLLAIQNTGFTQEELSGKPLGELRKMAKMVGLGAQQAIQQNRVMDYSGQAPVAQNTANDQEVLGYPTMNFDKKETAGAAK